ncbi:hypothetical protein T01_1056 [Trichinella spiralis]|uniref:PiggyBac transposable element-derived protein domain-containing protein n=1 Tax=Trichinella spiralis TaxID=6334 RepID=A0A0V0YWU3_TRISP|nr:hypothetical protein T01_1056 [Trichinella spiralis]
MILVRELRGRFHQYIPCKPGKYGIKIFWCCDEQTLWQEKSTSANS